MPIVKISSQNFGESSEYEMQFFLSTENGYNSKVLILFWEKPSKAKIPNYIMFQHGLNAQVI
jgi:hypothetical protein